MEDSYVLQLLKPKFKDFHLCFCGFAECKPLHSYGPAARPNYILHYVMKGKGIYQVGETKYPLKEGQAFLIEPESLTFYQADKTDPWSYLWERFVIQSSPICSLTQSARSGSPCIRNLRCVIPFVLLLNFCGNSS